METLVLKRGSAFGLLVILGVVLALLEFGGLADNRGALLVATTFWCALAQGALALVAMAELANARRIVIWKRELLAAYPLVLFTSLLFVLLLLRLDLYPWQEEPTAWLNGPFFVGRNLLLLAALCWWGRELVRSSLGERTDRGRQAVIYLFLFVTFQSLVAFDWVMSLDYPWYSTLFGAYFFVEAAYAGMGLGGLAAFFCYRARLHREPDRTAGALEDLGSLLFGFSILWGGLFFAQYLLIWYGNLPEEVLYLQQRIEEGAYRVLAAGLLAGLFGCPFLVLLSHRAKRNPLVLALVSLVLLGGLFAERLLMVWPSAPLHPGVAGVQGGLIGAAWLLLLHSREELFPQVRGDRADG